MRNRIFFAGIFLLLCGKSIFAQQDSIVFDDIQNPPSSKKLSDKVFFGGSFGLQFGTLTAVSVNPVVGYRIFPFWEAGGGVSYTFLRDSYLDINVSYYGASLFTRVFPLPNLYGQAEYEMLNVADFLDAAGVDENPWLQGILVGAGYRQKIGKRSATQITVLFNIDASSATPYTNPVIRVEFIY